MTKLSEILADFILGYNINEKSDLARQQGALFFKDCYGCMLAGGGERATEIVLRYSKKYGGKPEVPLVFSKTFSSDPCTVAMICGTAAHAHDYDDVSISVTAHPSVVVLPAALTEGIRHRATGEKTLEAYMLGVDVMSIMGRALNPAHYSRGWHNTGTIGVFGAAAAAGKLLGLDKQQLMNALGIAASRSAGLKGNFGTNTKPLHAGLAASNGVFAAEMAKLGMDANADIFEIEGGFIPVTTGRFNQSAVDDFVTNDICEFTEPGLAMKPYPSCKATHNGISATLALKNEYGFDVGDVESIDVECQPIAKDLLKYEDPQTRLQGKFSMNYCIACALIYGKVTLEQFSDGKITDEPIRTMMNKIYMEINPEIAKGDYYNGTWETAVTIRLLDGRKLYRRMRYAPGDAETPLSPQEASEKFLHCISMICDKSKAGGMTHCLDNLTGVKSIGDLVQVTRECLK